MSPLPSSCSAPLPSRIVLESIFDETRNEMRAGRFALIKPGDDVDRRPLGGENQVDADRPRHLRQPRDRLFDLVAGNHHQVGELVDQHDDRRQRADLVAVVVQHRTVVLGLREAQVAVVLLDVAHADRRQRLVALLHLAHGPAQRVRGLLRIDDHRREQVRNVLVHPELEALRVDHDQPHIVG